MRKSWKFLIAAVVLIVAADATLAAQQEKKIKKPKQTHDLGIDDADIAVVPDKNVEGVVFVQHPNGMVSAILDESFLEVTVAVKNADGTLSYQCVHGFPAASNHLKSAAKKQSVVKKPVSQLEVK
jgi:hypothetical protein